MDTRKMLAEIQKQVGGTIKSGGTISSGTIIDLLADFEEEGLEGQALIDAVVDHINNDMK